MEGTMQNYDDFKLPDETNMRNLRQGYANLRPAFKSRVNTLQNEGENATNNTNGSNLTNGTNNLISDNLQANSLFNDINWSENRDLLRILSRRANDRCSRSYIQGLIPLNEQDYQELSSYYTNSASPRSNPSVMEGIPNNFNSALREYIRSELELIDSLLQIMFIEDTQERNTAIYNIIRRRLDALDTLASFLAGGIFA